MLSRVKMAAVLKHWREAATLIITTPSRLHPATFPQAKNVPRPSDQLNNNRTSIAETEYETLLLKRSSKSKFMPNLYVFPGGTAVDNDFSAEWLSVFGKLGKDFQQNLFEKVSKGSSKASPMFTRERDPEYSKIPPEVAFRICAIRETFEESGILIVKKVNEQKDLHLSDQWNTSSVSDLDLTEWRLRVNENPDNFLTMCKEMDIVPDISSLYEWTNWLTPTLMGGKRFDTIFYICCLEDKPQAKEDTFETVDHQWISPSSLLSAHYKEHSISLAPPQVYEIARLLNFNKAADLMTFAADRESERVERIFPVIVFSKDATISLLPGDDLYPEKPDFYTPKKMIQYEETMEELNKTASNFHRTVRPKIRSDERENESLVFNLSFKNRHVGPVTNLEKLLKNNSKL